MIIFYLICFDSKRSKEKIYLTCTTPVIEVDKQLQARQQFLLGKSTSVLLDLSQADVEEAEFVEVKQPETKPKDVIDKEDYWQ